MTDIPGNSSTGAVISIGGTVTNTLEVKGDHDWFKLELTAGQEVVITLNGITLEDPYLRIRDASGNVIFENDDIVSGEIRDSKLGFVAPTTGTYYIDVGAWNEDYTGDYQLQVKLYTPPPVWTTDEVADFLAYGYWNGNSHRFNVGQGDSITVNITGLTASGQTLAREALALWSDVIGVSFLEVTTGGQIIFDDDQEGAFATENSTGGFVTSAHVNISTQWLSDYGTGINSYSFQTYLHEIGHALGLGHAGYYNGSADYRYDALFLNDGWPTTVMSYFSQEESSYFTERTFSFAFAVTPMIADIAAMSLLYGVSTATRTGDTTYGFNSNAGRSMFDASTHPTAAYAIVDSGGIDTLDYSGFSANQLIDLAAESFSNTGGLVGNVSIARGVTIENAIGGIGNDEIRGNAVANMLNGGAGNDTLRGNGGDDILIGGDGSDLLDGGSGFDTADYSSAAGPLSLAASGQAMPATRSRSLRVRARTRWFRPSATRWAPISRTSRSPGARPTAPAMRWSTPSPAVTPPTF